MALQTRADMELWDRPFQTLLIGVLAVNVASHFENVTWWVLLASAIALSWKLAHLYLGWVLPKRWMIYSAGAIVGGFVAWEYKTMLGHEAATPVLVFLASLKLLETNRDRDAMFIIVTSYFLLMAHLLHSQSLASSFFMAFDVALITILMYQLHRSDRRVTLRSVRPVVRLLIFTIPVWLILFFVFPRFSLKMFRTNRTVQIAGFSEGINPGSVSSLAQSDGLAFRVQFLSGPRRSPELLYWRGATLYDVEGMRWKPRNESAARRSGLPLDTLPYAAKSSSELQLEASELTKYEILTEPGQNLATFALPKIVRFEPGSGLMDAKVYVTDDALVRLGVQRYDHLQYTVWSTPELGSELESMSRDLMIRSTTLDDAESPAYEQLISDLRQRASGPFEAMSAIDEWLSENDFRYTLSPGDDGTLTIDDFLFRKRKGFCEHYASATATLLRSLGFNSRVIVGYQGGKWNDVSKALMVRSRDAHAWVEVWIPVKSSPGKGRWVTYDPTASIAPLRLRLGGDFLNLPEEQQQGRDIQSAQILEHLSQNFVLKMIDQTSMFWDYAQMSWTQFLLGYDRSGQRTLFNTILNRLGLRAGPGSMAILIALLVGVFLRLLFLWNARSPVESALRREWNHYELQLARIGAHRALNDGPLTIRDRVDSDILRKGIDAFIDAQYGEGVLSPAELREKTRLIREARRAAAQMPAA